MANIQIPNLPAVASLSGAELFEGVQSGTSVKISLNQIAEAIRFDTSFTIPILVSQGGTGVTTLTGYVKGSGTSPFTASSTIPNTDITGLGTMSTQNANAVAITGGTAALTGVSSVTANSGAAALTITQTGAGNSLVVEDSTNPDSSPFVVDQVGNVGIGASTGLTKKLNLASDASYDAATRMTNSANALGFEVGLLAGNADATSYVYQRANSPMLFGTNNSTRMTIDASGNVGVGVSGPIAAASQYGGFGSERFTVQSAGNSTNFSSTDIANSGAPLSLSRGNNGPLAYFFSNGTSVGFFNATLTTLTLNAASNLVFGTNGSTERFRFGTSGQFGIGGANYGTSGQTIISAGSATAPAWGAVGAAGGGTGITSYVIGDILFASSTTTLSKLADVATGNALISGGVGVAPSYGKIGLTTHVSGTLGVGNGGTGVTTSTGSGAVVLDTGPTITGAALNGTVGATTPSTGVFTTISASSTVSGTGFSTYLASPPAIGSTAASTGAFTTLSASSTVSGTGFSTYLASPPAIGGTAAASVTGSTIVSTSVITDGYSLKAAGTLALAFTLNGVVQVTPNATGTFTTTVPPAGTRCTLIVLTSGASSFTMTFGTGFKTTGTLATGTVSARYFIFQFISDGTSVIEASRTVAIA